jgi:hypothetical protein
VSSIAGCEPAGRHGPGPRLTVTTSVMNRLLRYCASKSSGGRHQGPFFEYYAAQKPDSGRGESLQRILATALEIASLNVLVIGLPKTRQEEGVSVPESVLLRSPSRTQWYLYVSKDYPLHSTSLTFRFNRRTSRSRGMLFYRLLQQAVETAPTTYKSMVGATKERHDHNM